MNIKTWAAAGWSVFRTHCRTIVSFARNDASADVPESIVGNIHRAHCQELRIGADHCIDCR